MKDDYRAADLFTTLFKAVFDEMPLFDAEWDIDAAIVKILGIANDCRDLARKQYPQVPK